MLRPQNALLIEITHTDIFIQGVNVASVSEVLQNSNEIIPKLKDELTYLATNISSPKNADEPPERKITIMGDENISYDLIRKILTTCQQAKFTKIAFAATQKSKAKS